MTFNNKPGHTNTIYVVTYVNLFGMVDSVSGTKYVLLHRCIRNLHYTFVYGKVGRLRTYPLPDTSGSETVHRGP